MDTAVHVNVPGCVHAIKCMIKFVFSCHVAEGAKVVVIALDTLPPHSCQLKATDVAHDTMVLDAYSNMNIIIII